MQNHKDSLNYLTFDRFRELLSYRNNEMLPSIEEENTGDI